MNGLTANPATQDILGKLRSRRNELATTLASVTAELAGIDGAIAALGGEAPKPVAAMPSVRDMARAALGALKEKHPPGPKGLVVDNATLVEQILKLHPGASRKTVKQGLYASVAWFIKENILKRAPGGYEVLA